MIHAAGMLLQRLAGGGKQESLAWPSKPAAVAWRVTCVLAWNCFLATTSVLFVRPWLRRV